MLPNIPPQKRNLIENILEICLHTKEPNRRRVHNKLVVFTLDRFPKIRKSYILRPSAEFPQKKLYDYTFFSVL